jgi:3-methyl-2-oxobutanoate hydroxymethyltransferase
MSATTQPQRPAPDAKPGAKPVRRVTLSDIARMHAEKRRIAMLTAYDYPTARVIDDAGVPLILVGDSVGMVMLGYEETVRVTMEEMLHHTKAVVRGTRHSLVVGDMPFMSYGVNIEQTLANAGRFISEGGAQAVKVEGGVRSARTIEAIAKAGIPVMGHIGLTPQSVHGLGGHKVQGKTVESARHLLADAFAVQEAGAFAVVLELVPAELATAITDRLKIPTIGIGAGAGCSGQVQVITDLLGLTYGFIPKHARKYENLAERMTDAISAYATDVAEGTFPAPENSSSIAPDVLAEVLGEGALDRAEAVAAAAIGEPIPLDRDL